MVLPFSGLNFSQFLAVANFPKIHFNESFCPEGYSFCQEVVGKSVLIRWKIMIAC